MFDNGIGESDMVNGGEISAAQSCKCNVFVSGCLTAMM